MMGVQQAIGLAGALKYRLIDRVRAPVKVEHEHIEPTEIQIDSYNSSLPFNPDIVGRFYKKHKQDVLELTGQPTLITEFEYKGAVYKNARMLSDGVTHVSVFDSNNVIQIDYSAKHRIEPAEMLKRKPSIHIAGTTINLCAPIATVNGNYCHWLIDGLSRWILINDRAVNPVKVDKYLIPKDKHAFRESLQVLGIDDNQIVELEFNKVFEFDSLVCVSKPRGYASNVVPGWLIDGYRARFHDHMAEADNPTERIYISRKDANGRKFEQEDMLASELENRGFEIVELSKLGLKEKAALFSQASHVIGLSGAGMASVMFCPPSTQVIEIYPSNFIVYLFATISAYLGHKHHPYIFKNTSKIGFISRHSGEFNLDVQDFLTSVDRWMSESE